MTTRSRYEEIEIVDIDDPPVVSTLTDSSKRKVTSIRRSTGPGGKSPRFAIPAKPLRRPAAAQSKKTIQCFDIDDDEEEKDDDSNKDQDSDSDDDIEVLEDEDPLEDGELVEEELSGGFCDLCGLHLPSETQIEKHQDEVHNITSCKWCQTRIPLMQCCFTCAMCDRAQRQQWAKRVATLAQS